MGRPTGVTVLAILDFLGGALWALVGLGFMLGGGAIAAMMKQSGGQGAGAALLGMLGAAAGICFLIGAAILIALGIGLLKLANWARIGSIVLTGFFGILQLIGLLGTLTHFNIIGVIWGGFWLGIDVLIIWYLLQPQVAAAFRGQQARGATA